MWPHYRSCLARPSISFICPAWALNWKTKSYGKSCTGTNHDKRSPRLEQVRHFCLSNAMHSIGQSIKSPLCPCVRACVRASVRDFREIFAPVGGFRGCAIECCRLHFSPTDPRCHGNEIWDKIGYNSACVRDFREIFAPVGGFRGCAIECCQFHFSPTDIWN